MVLDRGNLDASALASQGAQRAGALGARWGSRCSRSIASRAPAQAAPLPPGAALLVHAPQRLAAARQAVPRASAHASAPPRCSRTVASFDLDVDSFQQIPAEFFSEDFDEQWLEVFNRLSSYQSDEVRPRGAPRHPAPQSAGRARPLAAVRAAEQVPAPRACTHVRASPRLLVAAAAAAAGAAQPDRRAEPAPGHGGAAAAEGDRGAERQLLRGRRLAAGAAHRSQRQRGPCAGAAAAGAQQAAAVGAAAGAAGRAAGGGPGAAQAPVPGRRQAARSAAAASAPALRAPWLATARRRQQHAGAASPPPPGRPWAPAGAADGPGGVQGRRRCDQAAAPAAQLGRGAVARTGGEWR